MPKLSSEVTIEPIDIASVQRLVPAILEECRRVDFDEDGFLQRPPGQRHAGVRVESGTHPQVGTTYRAIEPVPPGPDEPDADDADRTPAEQIDGLRFRPTPFLATLVEDSDRAVRVSARSARNGSGEATLIEPRRPVALTATVSGDFSPAADQRRSGRQYFGGQLTLDGRIDIDRLPDGAAPQMTGRARHRRFGMRGSGRVTADGTGWRLRVELTFHGRGLMRPPVAVAALFIRPAMKRSLDAELRKLPARVVALNRAIASTYSESPESAAARLVDNVIADIDTAGSGR